MTLLPSSDYICPEIQVLEGRFQADEGRDRGFDGQIPTR